jgi:hypothetical protein
MTKGSRVVPAFLSSSSLSPLLLLSASVDPSVLTFSPYPPHTATPSATKRLDELQIELSGDFPLYCGPPTDPGLPSVRSLIGWPSDRHLAEAHHIGPQANKLSSRPRSPPVKPTPKAVSFASSATPYPV